MLALLLARHGVRSSVVEQTPKAERESRSLNIWARALETFRDLGVLEDLLQAGTFVDRLEPIDARTGRRLFSLDFTGLDEVTPVAGTLMCPQNRAEQVMRAHAEAEPLISHITATCVAVEQDRDEVTVTLEHDSRTWTMSAEYVVGADGARSTVRNSLGVPLEGDTHDAQMMLSDERISPAPDGWVRFALDEPGFLVGIRFSEHDWRVMGSLPAGTEEPGHDIRQRWLKLLFGDVSSTSAWGSRFRLHRRIAREYRTGRVLLAGDAAHLISPIGGQGLNAGFGDAENLAWKLAEVLHQRGDIDLLLDSYHNERHSVMTDQIARQIDQGTRAELSSPGWAKRITVRALAMAMAVPSIRTGMARSMSMLNSSYPSSASRLFLGDHPLVRTRLSDPRVAGGSRLSDSLRGRAALVLCGDVAEPVSTGLPVVRVPEPPEAWKLRGPAVLIVRPDRHVGAVVPAASATADLTEQVRTVLGRPVITPSPAPGRPGLTSLRRGTGHGRKSWP
jgi:2-polyprenyl-6-methoxyphenol hydroxylase-like FAD-dependent oxidoreductase